MKKCEYGCGQKAKFQLKNKRWCCNKSTRYCPEIIRKSSISRTGKKRNEQQRKRISKSHIGQESTKKGLTYKEIYGEYKAKKIKEKLRNKKKLTLDLFIKRYPLIFLADNVIEDDFGIKVLCKNSACQKYFIPTYTQVYERYRALTKPAGYEENNFYCSEVCKKQCYLYGKTPDSLENITLYTYEEYIQFKQEVYRRQKKEYGYNFCEYCNTTKDLLIHHEKPKKTHPHMILDPDNGIIICTKCHKIIHQKGNKCSFGNLSRMVCSQEVKNQWLYKIHLQMFLTTD